MEGFIRQPVAFSVRVQVYVPESEEQFQEIPASQGSPTNLYFMPSGYGYIPFSNKQFADLLGIDHVVYCPLEYYYRNNILTTSFSGITYVSDKFPVPDLTQQDRRSIAVSGNASGMSVSITYEPQLLVIKGVVEVGLSADIASYGGLLHVSGAYSTESFINGNTVADFDGFYKIAITPSYNNNPSITLPGTLDSRSFNPSTISGTIGGTLQPEDYPQHSGFQITTDSTGKGSWNIYYSAGRLFKGSYYTAPIEVLTESSRANWSGYNSVTDTVNLSVIYDSSTDYFYNASFGPPNYLPPENTTVIAVDGSGNTKSVELGNYTGHFFPISSQYNPENLSASASWDLTTGIVSCTFNVPNYISTTSGVEFTMQFTSDINGVNQYYLMTYDRTPGASTHELVIPDGEDEEARPHVLYSSRPLNVYQGREEETATLDYIKVTNDPTGSAVLWVAGFPSSNARTFSVSLSEIPMFESNNWPTDEITDSGMWWREIDHDAVISYTRPGGYNQTVTVPVKIRFSLEQVFWDGGVPAIEHDI